MEKIERRLKEKRIRRKKIKRARKEIKITRLNWRRKKNKERIIRGV